MSALCHCSVDPNSFLSILLSNPLSPCFPLMYERHPSKQEARFWGGNSKKTSPSPSKISEEREL